MYKRTQEVLSEIDKLKQEIENFIRSTAMAKSTGVTKSEYDAKTQGLADIQKEIDARNAEKMELFTMGPLYAKPAYYLDSFTPMIKVIMLLDINKPDDKNLRFEIFDSSKNPLNNHVKGFNVDYLGQGGGLKFTLSLSDIDNKLTDLLSFQIMALQVKGILPWFEVEYGWAYTKKAYSESNQEIRFTKKIFCILGGEDGDSGFNATANINGLTDLSLVGKYDSTPPAPKDQSPMMILGPCPGVNLTSYYIYDCLETLLCGQSKLKLKPGSYDNNIKLLIKEIYIFLTKVHGLKVTPAAFKTLIINMILYFRAIGSIDGTLFPYNVYDTEQEPKENDTLSARYNGDWTIRRIEGAFKTLLRFAEKGNKKECVSSKTIISRADLIASFKRDIIDDMLRVKRSYEIGKSPMGKHNFITSSIFFDFFRSYIVYASEMKIHPYYVWNYVWEAFDLNLQNQGAKVILLDDGLIGDNAIEALSTNESSLSFWKTISFDTDAYKKKNIGSVLPSCEKALDITNKEHREKYMNMAIDFNISNSQDWGGLFNSIGAKMKINYYIESKFEASVLGTTVEKKDYKKSKYGKLIIKPMSLKVSMQYVPKKQAKETLDTFKKLLDARKIKLQKFSKGVNKALAEKMIGNIDLQLKALESIKSKYIGDFTSSSDKTDFFYIGYRNVMPLDSAMSNDLNATKILQCYSTRPRSVANGKFNNGEKSCWDINFPDVVDFGVENFKPFANATALSQSTYFSNEKYDMKETGLDDYEKQIGELRKKFETAKNEKKKDKEKTLSELSSSAQTLYKEIADFETKQERLKHPVKFKIGHYGDTIVQGDEYAGVIGRTKQIQEMRYMISTMATTYNVNMKVIGDASFDVHDIGKYLFVKYIHSDGGIGYFTGMYNINGITDEIRSGEYMTTFKLAFQPILSSSYPDLSEEFTKHIYGEGGGTYESTNGLIKK